MHQNGELFNSAVSYHRDGDLVKAEELYNKILLAYPAHVDTLVNLAAIVYNRDPQSALDLLRKARSVAPDSVSVHFNLGNLLQRHNYRQKAINEFREVIRLNPNYHEAYFRLGMLFSELGKLEDSIFCYKKAFEIKPDDVRVVNNLTDIYNRLKKFDEAEEMARKTLELTPNLAEAHGNLGNVYKNQGNYEKAEFHFKEALKSHPEDSKILYHLGATLLFSNRAQEAASHLKKSMEQDPTFHHAHSSYVYALNYFEEPTKQEIFEAHCDWGKQQSKGVQDNTWSWIDRNPDKKIRVGFVSPDFRAHVVALFIQQLFSHYDKKQFEFYGYAEVANPDGFTSKFMGQLDGWRTTIGLTDEMVYETIKKDKIDILVDLAGHSAGNRLVAFSMKPAPVQVSYLGYINTTGLNTIDYRFADEWVNPEESQQFYSEKLYRLPNSFTCYEPIHPCPEVTETPALKNGYITFGCFNNTNKLTPKVIELWCGILKAVPDSGLLLKSSHLADEDTCKRFLNLFSEYGISKDRVQLEGPSEIYDYMAAYSKIDIALDPFPHNGGTTSHDALWMGVPMISLEGDRYVSRFGVTILNNLGYPDWIAKDEEEYIEIAKNISSNIDQLNDIRLNLRQKMASSPLCDGKAFAGHFGNAIKTIWKDFCAE